jgi:putative ABC transport system ATP-binding protein
MIGMIDNCTSGEIYFEGSNIDSLSNEERARIRTEIPFIFQFYNLIEYYNATDNVGLALAAVGVKDDKIRKNQAEEMLEVVGLGHRLKNKPEELSGGEQQRVAIARAMIVHPKIILADEPTGDLDRKTGGEILELFEKLNQDGNTFVIVTHDPNVAALGKTRIQMEDYRIISVNMT